MSKPSMKDTKAEILKAYEELQKEKTAPIANDETDKLKAEIEELKNLIGSMKTGTSNEIKRVHIMNVSRGRCDFLDGKFDVRLGKPFDIEVLPIDIFRDFYRTYSSWFKNLNLLVMEDEVVEEMGLRYYYKDYVLSKDNFLDLVSKPSDEIVHALKGMKSKEVFVFIEAFIREVAMENPDVMNSGKQMAVQGYINNTFNTAFNIVESAQELKDRNIV
jgi:hypothetical protein